MTSTLRSYKVTVRVEAESKEAAVALVALANMTGLPVIDCHQFENPRTSAQNRAIHLFFTQLADALNDAGFDMKKTIQMDIPWTGYGVKEYIWRPTQEWLFGKKSTTELTSKDIDKLYEVINRAIGERTGVHVAFPSRYEESQGPTD